MSNYNIVTNQVCKSLTNKMTFAAYVGIGPAKPEEFMEIVSGKIPLTLRDFSHGKGSAAKTAYYNLDLPAADWIYEMSRPQNIRDNFTYFGTKIYGGSPQQQGQYRGLCQTFRISIFRQNTMQNGTKSTYPWGIRIINGYAKANPGSVKGSFYEARGTFVTTSDLTMRFADEEFYRLFRAIHIAIMEATDIYAKKLIPAGQAALEAERTKNGYRGHGTQNVLQQPAQPMQQTYPPYQPHGTYMPQPAPQYYGAAG